tara:strand:- start:2426 stop:2815 length:390 start_codon:yes stop_codon:yes gene_type:complete
MPYHLLRFSFFLLFLLGSRAFGAEVHEQLASPAQEAQAQKMGYQIKCPTCQGQSIEDSHAEIASILRSFVRERLRAGDSEEEIFSLLKETYGESILFDPSWSIKTLFLWLTPFLFILFFTGFLLLRRRS